MSEKEICKHLIQLENQFAANNPVLQQATKVFHELDQIEFSLGLLDFDDTTARKTSWWPIISLIAPDSIAKTQFINQFLGSAAHPANVHSASHKFTVFQYTQQATLATLPGTALDVDHRLPFYQISQKLERFKAGEGAKINAYLELKTLNSSRLKNRLFVEAPDFNTTIQHPACHLLNRQVTELSDLVLIFTSVFETESESKEQLIANIMANQDENKFIYIIDHSDLTLTPEREQSSIALWRKRLSAIGLHTGQYLVLSASDTAAHNKIFFDIDERLRHVDNDRSYRVLHTLEKSIRDIPEVVIPEVGEVITRWKERCNFSTLIILGLFVSLMLFAEISMGILDLLIDPIIGPASLVALIAVLIPLHVMVSKVHAKTFIKQLAARQYSLGLSESLPGMFEKSLKFWRILLPINEPVGSSKKYRKRYHVLNERVKDLVQALNDHFSADVTKPTAIDINNFDE